MRRSVADTSDITLSQLVALNKWLEAVFDDGTRLSTLLGESGLSEAEIEAIKTDHLAAFVQVVVAWIAHTTDGTDGERRNSVMVRHYGLLDGKGETLQVIGDSLGVSRERIRQIEGKRIRYYRSKNRRAQFKADIAVMARELLDTQDKSHYISENLPG